MNEETELTVNTTDDDPGKRPAKKVIGALVEKPVKKKAAVKKAPAKKAPAKKVAKKVPTKKAKVGKSLTPAKKTGKKPTRKSGVGGRKPGKSATKAGSGKTSRNASPTTKTSKGTKTPGKSPKAGAKTRSGKEPSPSVGRGKSSPTASVDTSGLKPDRLYGLTRVNQPHKGNLGWWLRIGPKGSRHDQFFADKKNGGEAKTLKLATAKRNELYAGLSDKLKRRGSLKRKVA